MFLQKPIMTSTQIYLDNIYKLKNAFLQADAIIIGAGAGLSTAAGFTYDGKRFMKYFSDFHEKYGITNMYAGGFYPFDSLEEYWAYWSRYIYINRYQEPLKPVYQKLYQLVKNKDYFVLTTNVDHCFQKAGFDKQRLFYSQGDYGLFQCSKACQPITYDNEKEILNMISKQKEMKIPTQEIPYCPHCGALMTMNLRSLFPTLKIKTDSLIKSSRQRGLSLSKMFSFKYTPFPKISRFAASTNDHQ